MYLQGKCRCECSIDLKEASAEPRRMRNCCAKDAGSLQILEHNNKKKQEKIRRKAMFKKSYVDFGRLPSTIGMI